MGLEKFKEGQFSLTEEEKKKAKKEGNLAEQEEKIKAANKKTAAEKQEKALKESAEEIDRLSSLPEEEYQKERKKTLEEAGVEDLSDQNKAA